MSYLAFLLLFIIPPTLFLAVWARSEGSLRVQGAFKVLLMIQGAAFIYTTPWDNYLVYRGVWGYGQSRVIGTIGYVPVEEYLFFLLQPLLTGLWYLIARSRLRPYPYGPMREPAPSLRTWGTAGWALVALSGAFALLSPNDHLLYFGLIAAWCGPVLAGMTWLGHRHVWLDRKAVTVGILGPTLYLWAADRFAIGNGIWDIADRYSTGLEPFGLPIEEALFFLVTNTMVVQGLAMLLPLRETAYERSSPL